MFNDRDVVIEENNSIYEGRFIFSEVVKTVMLLLKDEDARLRSSAARVLGNIKAGEAVDDLIKLLNDPDPDIRCDAATALGCIGDKSALLSLNQCLNDEDGLVILSAIHALAEIGDNASVVPLIQAITSKKDFFYDLGGDLSGNYCWEIQEKAAHALGRINDHRSVQALLDMLKDDDAEYMLGTILQSLIRLGDRKGIEAAAAYLNDTDVSKRRKAARAFCYAKGNSVLEFIIEALVDEDSVVKINALEAIGNIAEEKDIIPVVLLLKDGGSDVRAKTIEVIGKVAGKKGIRYITPLLSDPAVSVRRKAAETLGNLNSKESAEPLIHLLKDADDGVAAEAILSLGKIGDERAVRELIVLLTDKNRPAAFQQGDFSLANIKAIDGIKAIIDIIKDKNEDKGLKKIALQNLKNCDKQMALDDISKIIDSCDGFTPLEKGISQTNDVLFDSLKSEDVNIRCRAIKALSDTGDKDAVESIISLLKDNEKEVRRAAILGLGRLCDKRAIRLLAACLFDYEFFDDLRNEIAMSLKKIDIDESTILMLNILSNKNESRNNHWTAMEALSVIHGAENLSSVKT